MNACYIIIFFFFYNLTLSSQWLNLPSHVEKQLSHEHINVWAAQIFIFVTGPSNTQIMKMKSSS